MKENTILKVFGIIEQVSFCFSYRVAEENPCQPDSKYRSQQPTTGFSGVSRSCFCNQRRWGLRSVITGETFFLNKKMFIWWLSFPGMLSLEFSFSILCFEIKANWGLFIHIWWPIIVNKKLFHVMIHVVWFLWCVHHREILWASWKTWQTLWNLKSVARDQMLILRKSLGGTFFKESVILWVFPPHDQV